MGQKKQKRGSTGLNMAIAYMHGLNNRLVGLQMTSGNVIGIAISAIQVTGGALIVAHPVWYLALALAPITCSLAIAIERLSLGGLGIVRRAVGKLVQLADAYFEMQQVERRKPTELEAYNYNRQKSMQIWTLIGALIVVALGVLISGFVGDQFWKWVWSSAGEPVSTILGIACAVVISLGFVFSELFKQPSDEEIEDRVADDRIQLAVLRRAERDLQIGLGLEGFGNVRADREKKQQAVSKIEDVALVRLEEFADHIGELAGGNAPMLESPNTVEALPQRAESVSSQNGPQIAEPVAEPAQEKASQIKEPEQPEASHVEESEQPKAPEASQGETTETTASDGEQDGQDEQDGEQQVEPPVSNLRRVVLLEDVYDQLIEMLSTGSFTSVTDVGIRMGVPRSTMGRWIARVRRELEQMQAERDKQASQVVDADDEPASQVVAVNGEQVSQAVKVGSKQASYVSDEDGERGVERDEQLSQVDGGDDEQDEQASQVVEVDGEWDSKQASYVSDEGGERDEDVSQVVEADGVQASQVVEEDSKQASCVSDEGGEREEERDEDVSQVVEADGVQVSQAVEEDSKQASYMGGEDEGQGEQVSQVVEVDGERDSKQASYVDSEDEEASQAETEVEEDRDEDVSQGV